MSRHEMETFLILCGWRKSDDFNWVNDLLNGTPGTSRKFVLESAYCIQMRGVDIWKRIKERYIHLGCNNPEYRHAMKEAAEHVTT